MKFQMKVVMMNSEVSRKVSGQAKGVNGKGE